MYLDLQTGLRMQKAACAFLSVPLADFIFFDTARIVDKAARYVKAVTYSRTSPPQMVSPLVLGD